MRLCGGECCCLAKHELQQLLNNFGSTLLQKINGLSIANCKCNPIKSEEEYCADSEREWCASKENIENELNRLEVVLLTSIQSILASKVKEMEVKNCSTTTIEAVHLPESTSLMTVFESEWESDVLMPFFNAHEDQITDYEYICTNPSMLVYLLSRDDLKCKLDLNNLSNNSGLTIDIVIQHVDIKWNQYYMCLNPGITIQDIIHHPEFPWDWEYGVSFNPNLTMSMIIQYPDKQWDWSYISANPGITMQNIINHPEYLWDWNQVFANDFTLDKSLYVNNRIRRLLLVSMLDDYNKDTFTSLNPTLLVLYNDYHLSSIIPYI